MSFDNEEQKKLLLALIDANTYKGIKGIEDMGEFLKAVKDASISKSGN